MHVHNVSDFAPPGYRLARTEYEGCTRHVFARLDGSGDELALECRPASAAEEVGYLEAFQALHTPKPAEPTEAHEAPAKPSRRRA